MKTKSVHIGMKGVVVVLAEELADSLVVLLLVVLLLKAELIAVSTYAIAIP